MSDLQVHSEQQNTTLDSWVVQYEAAYAAHRRAYELRVPPPALQDFSSIEPAPVLENVKRNNTLTKLALVVLVVAALIVAGSRTISEFGGGFVGLAGFVMINIAVVVYAFIRTSTNYTSERHTNVQRLISIGMWVAFGVDVFANIHAVLKIEGFTHPILNLGFTIVVGLSAPVLAFIAGDTFGLYAVRDSKRHREAEDAYRQNKIAWANRRAEHEQGYNAILDEWREGLNRSWNAQKANMGVTIRVERPQVQQLDGHGRTNILSSSAVLSDGQADGRTHATGQGYKKRTDARTIVWTHLDANPDDAGMKVRDLAEKIGVGKSTVSEVARQWKANHDN